MMRCAACVLLSLSPALAAEHHSLGRPVLRDWSAVSDLRARPHGPASERLHLSFTAKGRSHSLNLTHVDDWPADARVTIVRSGVREDVPPPRLATYAAVGRDGRTHARAVLLPGGKVRVAVRDGDDVLTVAHSSARTLLRGGAEAPEVVAYHTRDVDLGFADDALEPGHELLSGALAAANGAHRGHGRRLKRFGSCPGSKHRLVMGVVLDSLFTGTVEGALAEFAQILASANLVYEDQLNLRLVVDNLIVFEGHSPPGDPSLPPNFQNGGLPSSDNLCRTEADSSIDSSELLGAFTSWASSRAPSRTLWHLLTGCDVPGSTAGRAYTGVTCGSPANTAWTSDIGAATWLVFAHEVRAPATRARAAARARRRGRVRAAASGGAPARARC